MPARSTSLSSQYLSRRYLRGASTGYRRNDVSQRECAQRDDDQRDDGNRRFRYRVDRSREKSPEPSSERDAEWNAHDHPRKTRYRGLTRNRRDERSEEHTSELQSLRHLVCRLLLE